MVRPIAILVWVTFNWLGKTDDETQKAAFLTWVQYLNLSPYSVYICSNLPQLTNIGTVTFSIAHWPTSGLTLTLPLPCKSTILKTYSPTFYRVIFHLLEPCWVFFSFLFSEVSKVKEINFSYDGLLCCGICWIESEIYCLQVRDWIEVNTDQYWMSLPCTLCTVGKEGRLYVQHNPQVT